MAEDVAVEKEEATKGKAKENRRVRPKAWAKTLERRAKTRARQQLLPPRPARAAKARARARLQLAALAKEMAVEAKAKANQKPTTPLGGRGAVVRKARALVASQA